MSDELMVLLSDREVGRVRQGQRRRLKFIYNDEWRETQGAYPLSLSMPLAASEHPHGVIEAFIWGLLPENELVLERWARKFQVSARSAFALISHVGEDCAGAVQFVRPDRLDAVRDEGPGDIDWLDESDIATRLKTLLRGSFGLAAARRYRPVQPCGGAAQDRAAAAGREMGHTFGTHSHNSYSEAPNRRLRRPRRKRTFLSCARARPRNAGRIIDSHAFRR